METNRRQNGPRLPALPGGLVAVLAAAFLVLAQPAGAGPPAPDDTGAAGSSVTGTRTAAPQQALHAVTTTAVGTALRLADSGGCPTASVQPILAPQPTE